MEEELKKLSAYLLKLTQVGFYGKLVIAYEKGKIVNIKKEENIKLGQIG